MLHIEDQDHDLVVADLVQDSPVTGPHSPGPWIPDKLRGLSWPGIFRKPVNHASYLLADYGSPLTSGIWLYLVSAACRCKAGGSRPGSFS